MTLPPIHFAAPSYLWALLAVPALLLLHVWSEGRAQRRLALLISSPRLRAELTAAASAARRRWRYGLLLLALGALALTAARPQLGYETEIAHRKGIDLLVMVDVSKSMLATDLPPNRLTRAKLAAQDLITHLEGDRAGLLAFAGSAFLQAPLTVDYDAVLTALADLDVNTIPLGGTNLEAAINLAVDAFGKAEGANRAIILMSDGETTAGEADGALKAAARANEAGIRIFTVGVGTPEGSLIPTGEPGSFIKDQDGKIVRTKLDEAGLDRLAKAAGGFYLRLQNGPAEMRVLAQEALGKMKAGEIDARATRKPIERYQWPLGAALLFLAVAACLNERRRQRAVPSKPRALAGAAVLLLLLPGLARSADDQEPMTLYQQGKYNEAYKGFSDLAKQHAEERRLEFDAGASAYRNKKYEDAMDAFGHAMTSEDPNLQAKSHYNMGNTLYQHGLSAKDSPAKVKEWRNAIEHYDSTIKLARSQADAPLEKDAVYNRDLVQQAIDEELKPHPTPTPTPSPSPTPTPDPKDKKKDQSKQDQPKPQPSPDEKKDGSPSPSPEGSPSPSPSEGQNPSPSPGEGKSGQPKPDENGQEGSPSPSDQGSPSPEPPRQRGDFKAQPGQTPAPEGSPSPAPEPAEKKGEMSPAQARALLDSLKGDDVRPNLNEQQQHRDDPTIKDW